MSEINAPADLAKVIDPLKEWFTWKWVGAAIGLVFTFFICFVSFCASIITAHYYWAISIILFFVVVFCIFTLYARTPETLEENWRGFLHYFLIKVGFNTFSKYSRRVRRWVIQNFSGLVEMDEETGLCREKTNQDMY